MISAKLIASSTPGIANARSCIIEPIIPLLSAALYRQMSPLGTVAGRVGLALLNHLLNGARRVDFHGKQVVEPVHFCCVLGKLLAERIREVVRRISGLGRNRGGQRSEMTCELCSTYDKKDGLADFGELDCEGARCRCFPCSSESCEMVNGDIKVAHLHLPCRLKKDR